MKIRSAFVVLSALALLSTFVPNASSSEGETRRVPNLWLPGWVFGVNCDQFGGVGGTVMNNGTGPSPRFLLPIQLDGQFIGKLAMPQELPAGETAELGPTGWHLIEFEPGVTHTVTVTVDPRDQINESSEFDNTSSTDFAC